MKRKSNEKRHSSFKINLINIQEIESEQSFENISENDYSYKLNSNALILIKGIFILFLIMFIRKASPQPRPNEKKDKQCIKIS